MPLNQPEDFASGDTDKNYCRHCARPHGSMKSHDEALEGMAHFVAEKKGVGLEAARQEAAAYMASMPAWQEPI